ncbi:1,4-dihydroxy-2-naphthoate octaprenyltransferase [Mariniflexile ostreae]|uniref:1,4-dihydroxy-2-naphthoate octaprenyltransferase n=1 Tax=Mariniflexile ostreae TaxID=1520892 RepID=A0ABV5FFE0_9FLAO
MNNISMWISSMRLRTLPLSVSGIILASFLAQHKGFFNWGIFILAMLTTLSLQILSNLANDYGDGIKGTDNLDRIGPQRAIQSGKISPESMRKAIKINIVVAIGLSFGLIFYAFGTDYIILTSVFLALGILSVVASIQYTVGSRAYGYRGLGDIFVFVFFGLVSVAGCYVLYAKKIDFIVVIPGCIIGLLSTAVLNLNNMRDRISDKKSNKITLAVKLGEQNVKIYHFILVVFALILSFLFGVVYYTSPFNLMFMVTYVPLFFHLKKVYNNHNPKSLDPELKKLALTTFFLAILMGIGQLF